MKQNLTTIAALLSAVLTGYGQASDAGAPTQPPKEWDVSAAAGLTLTSGNSDTLTLNANATATRKWDRNELNLGADLTYGEADDEKNAESYRAYGQYNRLLTERFFAYFRVEGLKDDVADVEYRVTLSPGVGYYFVKNEKTSLRAEAGPGVVFEKEGGEEDTYMTIRFAERFDHKLTDTIKIWQSLEYLPQIDDWGDYIVNAEVGFEVILSKHLRQRTYLQDSYNSNPAPDRKKNDLKLVAAIAYAF